MNELFRAMATLYGQFSISAAELDATADRFAAAMERGLAGLPSRLKMLPSFIDRPTGQESGEYLALDFGGTNLRLLAVSLDGRRGVKVLRRQAWPLRNSQTGVDLSDASVNAEALFDAIAATIGEFVPGGDWRLGHTFSFPCRQLSANKAELIHWTKEMRTSGVEGREISGLLLDALANRGLSRIKPVAVLNDTVAAYLAAAYAGEDVVAGAVCGTGHNLACFEAAAPQGPMAINLESGNFNPGMGTAFDAELDKNSEKPGEQLLEKQVAGHYLGELFRLVLISLSSAGILPFDTGRISRPYSLPAETMSFLLADEAALLQSGQFCSDLLGIETDAAQRRLVKMAATLIVTRSAQLAAAAFLGVLRRLDPAMTARQTIAVDGSLYAKMPGYRETIETVLVRHMPVAASRTCLVQDGSGIGAAIAAAICSR
ncbi:MAG: hexokinase [Sporomusaceae bacterium]|nr:hexokinase [Sporomusaceae bacterium]